MLHGGAVRPAPSSVRLSEWWSTRDQRVGLPSVPPRCTRTGERGDGPIVIEERVRNGVDRLETELIGDVGVAVAVIVDVDGYSTSSANS